jgi:hypothetical protein
VWRSVRAHGDTKTEKSKRTLRLPERAAAALRQHRARQAEQQLLAGELWQDRGLVFCTSVGTPLNAANMRRSFKKITNAVASRSGDVSLSLASRPCSRFARTDRCRYGVLVVRVAGHLGAYRVGWTRASSA